MKHKSADKKLSLNKETISRLEATELKVVKGGTSGLASLCCTWAPIYCNSIEATCHY